MGIPVGGTKRLRVAGGSMALPVAGGSMALPLVVTVTVNGAGLPFASDTLAGTWHAAPSGAPPHASDTVPL